jgi:hypothetical protein
LKVSGFVAAEKTTYKGEKINVTFTLLQGTGDAKELRIDIYNPAHGVGGCHGESKKTALRIELPAEDDTPHERKLVEALKSGGIRGAAVLRDKDGKKIFENTDTIRQGFMKNIHEIRLNMLLSPFRPQNGYSGLLILTI